MPLIGAIDGHPLGVALGLAHRVLGAIAADLQDLEVRFGRFPLEGVGRLQLIQGRLRLLDGEVVLLRLDARQQLVLGRLELGARRARSRPSRISPSSLTRAARSPASFFLICCSRSLSSARRSRARRELRLAIEFDDEIALFDRRPALTSLVMTSDCEFGPASRGAATVVDSTASTVPLSRTARTKSWRVTVAVVGRGARLSGFGNSRDRARASARRRSPR